MPIVLDGSNGIITPDLESSGPVIGTTGAFSGNVTANGISTELRPLVLTSAQASTSGTALDFTGIPAWAKRITVIFDGVSLSGTDNILVQLIVNGTPLASSYNSISGLAGASFVATATTGFVVYSPNTAGVLTGAMRFYDYSGTLWVSEHSGGLIGGSNTGVAGGGSVNATGVVTGVRITRSGTNTFDAGTIAVMYE